MNVSSHVNSSMQNLITLDTEIQVNLYTNSSYGCVSIANSFEMIDIDEVNRIMMKAAKMIPSYLFVPLTYQLFSRIGQPSDGKESFQKALRSIILKICIEHPYHGIVQLITLANGSKVGKGVSGRQSTTFLENVGDAKIEAAKELLNTIQKTAPEFIGSLTNSYNTLIDSYIALAMAPTEQFISGPNPRNKNIPLTAVASRQKPSLDRCLSSSRQWCDSNFPIPCIFTKPVSFETLILNESVSVSTFHFE